MDHDKTNLKLLEYAIIENLEKDTKDFKLINQDLLTFDMCCTSLKTTTINYNLFPKIYKHKVFSHYIYRKYIQRLNI